MHCLSRPEYIEAARDKATGPDERLFLEELLPEVSTLADLEQTFPDRLAHERAAAGIPAPKLSRAAKHEVEASVEAGDRVHKLYRRECRRAPNAAHIIQMLLTGIRDDIEIWEMMEDDHTDRVADEIVGDIARRKRALAVELQRFLERYAGDI